MKVSPIGLDPVKSANLAEGLNTLLANYQIFYMNVRGFHWNITGSDFFTLHTKFEEQYNDLLIKVDAIAERILTLGATPLHAYSDYLKHSEVKECTQVTDGNACVQSVLDGYQVLIVKQREILALASDAEDEGTLSLMSEYITEQEKTVWMLNAYLK